jgi:hypothetical protein
MSIFFSGAKAQHNELWSNIKSPALYVRNGWRNPFDNLPINPVDFVGNKVSVKGLRHLIIASLVKSSFKGWFKYTFVMSDDTRVPFISQMGTLVSRCCVLLTPRGISQRQRGYCCLRGYRRLSYALYALGSANDNDSGLKRPV